MILKYDMIFKYPKSDTSKYRQWLTDRYEELEKESAPSEALVSFVVIMAVVCSFETEGDSVRRHTSTEHQADLAKFEAGCYLLFTINRWFGPSISPKNDDQLKSWLFSFLAISTDALYLDTIQLHKIINSRIGTYGLAAKKEPAQDLTGTIADFIIRSIENRKPVEEEPNTPINLSASMFWVSTKVMIWSVCLFPIAFQHLKKDAAKEQAIKDSDDKSSYPKDEHSYYRKWITEEAPLLGQEIARTERVSVGEISSEQTGGRILFFSIMGVVCLYKGGINPSNLEPNPYIGDLARFEVGCYIMFLVSQWLDPSNPHEKKQLLGKYLATFSAISAQAISLPVDSIASIITNRFVTYGILSDTKKKEQELLEVLINFISYAMDDGKPIETRNRPTLSPSKNRQSASTDVNEWSTRFVPAVQRMLKKQ